MLTKSERIALEAKILSLKAETVPYRHWMLDFALPDSILDGVIEEFSHVSHEAWAKMDYKMQVKSQNSELNEFPREIKDLVVYFNSAEFLSILEGLTGINGLISDPYLEGGGLHEIQNGGRLEIHADFSRHSRLRLYRRLNLLVYLNLNWSPEYGGELNLYDNTAMRICKKVAPIANRMFLFETNCDSFHGHPDPLNVPPGITRKSIALYYYTVERSAKVRGIDTRWRHQQRRTAKFAFLRSPVARLFWFFAREFQQLGNKCEDLHTRIDFN